MLKKVFIWLFLGFLITFAASYMAIDNLDIIYEVFAKIPYFVVVIFCLPIVIAVLLSGIIKKIPPVITIILYIIYCVITGVSLGFVLLSFTASSIISCLLATGIIFLICAFISWNSDYDFSNWGKILLFSLIGAIVVSLLNYFIFNSELLYIAINAIVTAIFIGYMLYDVNRIKQEQSNDEDKNLPIQLAFQLYLDLINLFIRLLELFGRRK